MPSAARYDRYGTDGAAGAHHHDVITVRGRFGVTAQSGATATRLLN
ncbi:MAG TPA: hypothetical protein VEQ59_10475 [Polyangiaceae bacterium]|nr:hypothetical protein [Polyangiaceae bacterium]